MLNPNPPSARGIFALLFKQNLTTETRRRGENLTEKEKKIEQVQTHLINNQLPPFFCASKILHSPMGKGWPLTALFNSSTSTGHSGQLCSQHTIRSQPAGLCMCFRKLRLSYSNSILTICIRPSPTSRMASQSGNSVCTRSTRKPSRSDNDPNRYNTPASLTGANTSGHPCTNCPYIGRSASILGADVGTDGPGWYFLSWACCLTMSHTSSQSFSSPSFSANIFISLGTLSHEPKRSTNGRTLYLPKRSYSARVGIFWSLRATSAQSQNNVSNLTFLPFPAPCSLQACRAR